MYGSHKVEFFLQWTNMAPSCMLVKSGVSQFLEEWVVAQLENVGLEHTSHLTWVVVKT
jgi:hypothetical protein